MAYPSGKAMADVRDRRMILALASLAQFVVLLAVYSVGALAPLLREALHLSREQIGSLTAWPIGWACGAS